MCVHRLVEILCTFINLYVDIYMYYCNCTHKCVLYGYRYVNYISISHIYKHVHMYKYCLITITICMYIYV